MASDILPLSSGTGMVGARTVHHFSDLGLLHRMLGIQEKHLTRSDVIGSITEEKFELQGTRLDLGEVLVDRKVKTGPPRESWRCTGDGPPSDIALQMISRA
jgi:hypothetical protein